MSYGSGYLTTPPASKAIVGPDNGVLFKVLVPANMDISFDIRWELSQIMLGMRIVHESIYTAWLSDQRTQIIPWAHIYGFGFIRGRFYPPYAGQWVVFIDPAKHTWPAHKMDPIEVSARIVAAYPV